MLNTLFSPWPSFTVEEADAVRRVVISNKVNYWTGTETREFEKEFASWAGCRYAVALSNGTLALDVALKALGIGPDDEVTRDVCAETLALQGEGLTADEIESITPVSFADGGGFNCRHEWIPV